MGPGSGAELTCNQMVVDDLLEQRIDQVFHALEQLAAVLAEAA